MKNYSGATCETAQSLLIGAGTYFKNFEFGKDTYDTAKAAGKVLGATQGGGEFSAVPTVAEVPIDGADPVQYIEKWVVTMKANIIETKPGTFALALGTGVVTKSEKSVNYYSVKAKRHISEENYIENITYVGSISGSDDPVIIQIYNAISTTGLTISTDGKVGAAIVVTFTSRVDVCKNPEFLEYAPFEIFYPMQIAKPTVNSITDADAIITGTGIKGATVKVKGGDITGEVSGTVGDDKTWSITIPKQDSGTILTVWQEVDGKKSQEVTTIVRVSEVI